MTKDTKSGFFSDRSKLTMDDYVVFDYLFESFVDPEEAAAHLCQEQSTAQWKRPGVDEDLRGQFGAKVIDLAVEAVLEKPTMALPATPTAISGPNCRIY
jgi:ribulose-bisphosphate carboxylase large chain